MANTVRTHNTVNIGNFGTCSSVFGLDSDERSRRKENAHWNISCRPSHGIVFGPRGGGSGALLYRCPILTVLRRRRSGR